MTKLEIIDAIRAALSKEFRSFKQASQETRQSGNDDESKADGKYDTQSTEANYLADGQAKHAQKIVHAAAAYDAMKQRDSRRRDPIDVGALVKLHINQQAQWFFIGPAYGGLEIYIDDRKITVITAKSPVGKQLIGLQVGDSISSPQADIDSIS